MEQMIPNFDGQYTIQRPEQPLFVGVKRLYVSPRITVFGSVAELTRGSGGDYDDECTSGHKPGDDE